MAEPDRSRRVAFPGSFDPLTVAHVAIAEAALAATGLDGVDLVMSRLALAKDDGAHSSIEERATAIAALGDPRLRALVTDARLIADIAEGYGAVVVGADKWHQLHDESFYGSEPAMHSALARMPPLFVAPRTGVDLPTGVELVDVDPAHHDVSSTAVRAGRDDWQAT